MIDVKKINDANSSEKQHRFDLVVIGRVFQFYSDSREDCDNWVAVLHAAIARFQPEENKTMKEGGNLHDPEKQGVLLKQGRGMRQSFRERYVALKGSKFAYYENKEVSCLYYKHCVGLPLSPDTINTDLSLISDLSLSLLLRRLSMLVPSTFWSLRWPTSDQIRVGNTDSSSP
jgi:hypothetical protein